MLGSHIAEALLLKGYDVHGVVRPRSNARNIAPFRGNITVVIAELTDPWATLKIIREADPDYIFHFAAQAFNALSFDAPEYALSTNIGTTLNVLEAVRQLPGLAKKTRILLAGSSTVYGSSTNNYDGPIPESAAMQPVSPYGVSKAATEQLGLMYAQTHGLGVIVPRFFIHLAPRGVEALALHEFARQIALIERGLQDPVVNHGDISTQRDITDIVDSAPVVICLAETAPSGTVVNIGSNMTYTIKDLLEKAISLSNRKDIKLNLDKSRIRAYDEKIVLADITRVKSLTGWEPRPDMPHLIRLLLEYWRGEVAFRNMLSSHLAPEKMPARVTEL
jgi:nucleoside-diphosphate-sugar epimerase